jgi:hypothetical protein
MRFADRIALLQTLTTFNGNEDERPVVLHGNGEGGALENLIRDIKYGVRSSTGLQNCDGERAGRSILPGTRTLN